MKKHVILEGLDRSGKSTLSKAISHSFGYHVPVHYQKPEKLAIYGMCPKKYQEASFVEMFRLLSTDIPTIFDRAHLGEYVYSPRYRQYDGSYVFDLEDQFIASGSKFHENTRLILLAFHNNSIAVDDGDSFDWSKRGEEQEDFIRAFDRSQIKDKRIVYVDRPDGSGYLDYDAVTVAALG